MVDHLFLHCSLASKAWAFVSIELGISHCLPLKIDDFILEGSNGISLKGKVFVLWNYAIRALF